MIKEAPASLSRTSATELQLSGTLDFASVPTLLPYVKAELSNQQGPLQVNLIGVSKVNSAALALLVEISRISFQAGIKVHFSNIPETLCSLATSYNLLSFLPDDKQH